jgi:hypothetical protein
MQRCKEMHRKAVLGNKEMSVSEHDAAALDGMQCDAMRCSNGAEESSAEKEKGICRSECCRWSMMLCVSCVRSLCVWREGLVAAHARESKSWRCEWELHASSWSVVVGVARVAMVVASSTGLTRDATGVSAVSGPLACVQRAR